MPKQTPEDEYEFFTPIFNPPNNAPGWYFLFPRRNDQLGCHGPFDTRKECADAIQTNEPCESCGMPRFGEPDPAGVVRQGVVLCKDCEREFVDWHKKEHGKPPSPVGGVQ